MEKSNLIYRIKNLSSNEKVHILSILTKHDIEHTKNANGYFFNLENISIEIIDKLTKCVELIEKNRELIKTLDKKRDAQLEYYKSLIESKLSKSIQNKNTVYNDKFLVDQDNNEFKNCIKKKNKNKDNSNIDIEAILKENQKANKYKKDTLYYRIVQQFSRSKSRNYIKEHIVDDDVNYFENVEDGDNDDIIDDNIDIDDTIEMDDGDENYSLGDDINEDIHTEDKTSEYEDDINEEKDDDEISPIKNFEYYKNLLSNTHGYSFDYDKDVKMICEEYIK